VCSSRHGPPTAHRWRQLDAIIVTVRCNWHRKHRRHRAVAISARAQPTT
jgi:hypothetical protein